MRQRIFPPRLALATVEYGQAMTTLRCRVTTPGKSSSQMCARLSPSAPRLRQFNHEPHDTMRTNTYSHLEALASSKRIVCERTGKRITLTTPDGGTTAECDSVAEALDTLASDPTFSALPIVLAPARPAELYEYRLSNHTGETLQECTAECLDDAARHFNMDINRNFPTGANAAVLEDSSTGFSFLVTWRKVESESALAAKGEAIAKALGLRRDPDHADRYQTEWGSKTALGLARTLMSQLSA